MNSDKKFFELECKCIVEPNEKNILEINLKCNSENCEFMENMLLKECGCIIISEKYKLFCKNHAICVNKHIEDLLDCSKLPGEALNVIVGGNFDIEGNFMWKNENPLKKERKIKMREYKSRSKYKK